MRLRIQCYSPADYCAPGHELQAGEMTVELKISKEEGQRYSVGFTRYFAVGEFSLKFDGPQTH